MVEVVENCWHDWWVVDEGRVIEVLLWEKPHPRSAAGRASCHCTAT
jgi:hypothetical protein